MDGKIQRQREVLNMRDMFDKVFWIYRALPAAAKGIALCAIICWWLILTVYIVFHLQAWWCQVLFFIDIYVMILFLVSIVITWFKKLRTIYDRAKEHTSNRELV